MPTQTNIQTKSIDAYLEWLHNQSDVSDDVKNASLKYKEPGIVPDKFSHKAKTNYKKYNQTFHNAVMKLEPFSLINSNS